MGKIKDFLDLFKRKQVQEKIKYAEIDLKNMTLMCKDEPVADLKLQTHGVLKLLKLYNFDLLPLGIVNPRSNFIKETANENFDKIKENIGIWLDYRVIPNGRPNIESCLKKCGVETTFELSCKSFGLSFGDSYWLKPSNLNISWDEINLYDNGFSTDIGDILFDPEKNFAVIDNISPDTTTRGEDAKRWILENGNSYLLKTNYLYPQVAYNEVVAMTIGRMLGLNCAEYSITKGKIKIKEQEDVQEFDCTFSKSKNFCSKNKTYVPAGYLRLMTEGNTTKDLIWDLKEKYPEIYQEFRKMLVLDFIINNEDRHSENFGFEIDENKKLFISNIFDNGNSLYYDTNNINSIGSMYSKCKFDGYHDNNTMLSLHFQYKEDLDFFDKNQFKNIEQMITNIFNNSGILPERINAITNFIIKQIEKVEKFKEQLSSREQNRSYIEEER